MTPPVFIAYTKVWTTLQTIKTEEHLEVCNTFIDLFRRMYPTQTTYLTSLQMELQLQRINIVYVNAVGKGPVRFISRKSK